MNFEDIEYNHCISVQIRFSDIDHFGHVNNSKYHDFFDRARIDYLEHLIDSPIIGTEISIVLANVSVSFIKPVCFRDKLKIYTKMLKIGNKSIAMRQIGVNQKDEIVCENSSIHVCFNTRTQESLIIPKLWVHTIKDKISDIIIDR